MDYKDQVSRRSRLPRWLKWKHKGEDPLHLSEFSEGEEGDEDDDDYSNDDFVKLLETNSCILKNEFRVFVGTWNVAGRSPVRNLAEDLDEWLNLKHAADIYVLGFQEIVPLKARNVIGAEDTTPAIKWNSLIGKTLNNKFGCSGLSPVLNSNSTNDNQTVGIPSSKGGSTGTTDGSPTSTPTKDAQKLQQEEPNSYSMYKLMASKKMVGVFISVWMKKELLRNYCVSNVKVCSVACGIMGYLGNKGSVSVSMSIEGTSFCFIAAHLASGEKNGDEVRRNYQVSEIFRRTSFPRHREDDDNPHPLTILGHDRIFWFGDLNYRLYLEDNLARKLIKKKDWRALQEFDQLRKEQDYGGVFQGWREGNIEFAPTYKYSSSNCNRYSGGLPTKSGEKQRTPAWCDRILWYGKGVKQLSYFRSESKFSDHRPVSALFSTQIEVIKSNATVVPLPQITPPIDQTATGEEEKGEERKSTLLSLMVKDIELASDTRPDLGIVAHLDVVVE